MDTFLALAPLFVAALGLELEPVESAPRAACQPTWVTWREGCSLKHRRSVSRCRLCLGPGVPGYEPEAADSSPAPAPADLASPSAAALAEKEILTCDGRPGSPCTRASPSSVATSGTAAPVSPTDVWRRGRRELGGPTLPSRPVVCRHFSRCLHYPPAGTVAERHDCFYTPAVPERMEGGDSGLAGFDGWTDCPPGCASAPASPIEPPAAGSLNRDRRQASSGPVSRHESFPVPTPRSSAGRRGLCAGAGGADGDEDAELSRPARPGGRPGPKGHGRLPRLLPGRV